MDFHTLADRTIQIKLK